MREDDVVWVSDLANFAIRARPTGPKAFCNTRKRVRGGIYPSNESDMETTPCGNEQISAALSTKLDAITDTEHDMNYQATTRAIFLAGMVFASGTVAANTDIKKCVTEAGYITLTDEVCPSGSHAVKIISAPAAQADIVRQGTGAAPTVATERYAIARMPARYVVPMKSRTPERGLSLDISTLRAARASMQMFDNATKSLRLQRVAGLQ